MKNTTNYYWPDSMDSAIADKVVGLVKTLTTWSSYSAQTTWAKALDVPRALKALLLQTEPKSSYAYVMQTECWFPQFIVKLGFKKNGLALTQATYQAGRVIIPDYTKLYRIEFTSQGTILVWYGENHTDLFRYSKYGFSHVTDTKDQNLTVLELFQKQTK